MSKIGWGKPRIFIKRIDGSDSTWKEVPTPVQDSTSLETTKGDKLEAKLEGGMNEDVLYMASVRMRSLIKYETRRTRRCLSLTTMVSWMGSGSAPCSRKIRWCRVS